MNFNSNSKEFRPQVSEALRQKFTKKRGNDSNERVREKENPNVKRLKKNDSQGKLIFFVDRD